MKIYILDGYNVIHAVPSFERQLDRSLQAAREGLICFCAAYQSCRGDIDRIYIVFDGDDQYANFPSTNYGAVLPLFSSSKQEADERIVELLKELGRKGEVILVSNDNYVCNHARAFGVSSLRAEEFYRIAAAPSGQGTATADAGAVAATVTGRAGLSARKAREITDEYKRYLGIR